MDNTMKLAVASGTKSEICWPKAGYSWMIFALPIGKTFRIKPEIKKGQQQNKLHGIRPVNLSRGGLFSIMRQSPLWNDIFSSKQMTSFHRPKAHFFLLFYDLLGDTYRRKLRRSRRRPSRNPAELVPAHTSDGISRGWGPSCRWWCPYRSRKRCPRRGRALRPRRLTAGHSRSWDCPGDGCACCWRWRRRKPHLQWTVWKNKSMNYAEILSISLWKKQHYKNHLNENKKKTTYMHKYTNWESLENKIKITRTTNNYDQVEFE